MKAFLRSIVAAGLCLQGLTAQVVPTTPTKFGKRDVGGMTDGGGSASLGLSPQSAKPAPVVKEISYLTLSDARQWTSTDGKVIIGKLLAHEQMEQVLTAGQSAAATTTTTAAPALPARPPHRHPPGPDPTARSAKSLRAPPRPSFPGGP